MSAFDAEPVAETLMLSTCISPTQAIGVRSAEALSAAYPGTASAIPPEALVASEDGWRQAIAGILAIGIGSFFKAACLRLAAERPEVEIEPGGDATVTLLPFEITSSHHPRIIVTGGAVVVPLNFDVELGLTVEGARLQIKNGLVVGASTGTANGVARISLVNTKPPLELGTPSFELPGALRFSMPERSPLLS